jgi:dihydrofolate synthase/folylpolyglutamate synthase
MMTLDLLLSRFQGCKIGHSFGTITKLLRHFDNPQHRLPPVIHIAGTNGKGSTAALISAILHRAGYKVHRLTSPHLCCMTERIMVANKVVDHQVMASLLLKMAELTDGKIAFSEAVTATALYLFASVPADVVVLEVGIGGLYDGTNVISGTCVSIITPISFDHQSRLGSTLHDITVQKSGIMRQSVPCVSAPQISCVRDVLINSATGKGALLYLGQTDWFFEPKGHGFRIQYSQDPLDHDSFPQIGLAGNHQCMNGAVAVMALRTQRALNIPHGAMADGLAHVVWPGRLQRLTIKDHWGNDLDDEVWIDGAHNEGGLAVLAHHVRSAGWASGAEKPLVLVFGKRVEKNLDSLWSTLAPLAQQVCVIECWGNGTGTPWSVMKQGAIASGYDDHAVHVFATLDQFMAQIKGKKNRAQPVRFLMCGSLHLVGDVLKNFKK